MTDLRQRRHEQTRRAIVDAALALFVEHGFNVVSMDDIAQAAGVSRSTAYRRFPTKEDVVLAVPRRWFATFHSASAGHPTLPDAVRSASLAVAAHVDHESGTALAAYQVLDQVPSLRGSPLAEQAWRDRVVELIDQHTAVDAEHAAVVAGAYVGAINAMMEHWAKQGGTASVVQATTRLLDRLEPIWPRASPG